MSEWVIKSTLVLVIERTEQPHVGCVQEEEEIGHSSHESLHDICGRDFPALNE